jgi:hypothetical protein
LGVVKKYMELTDEAEIALEANRNAVLQGLYWVVAAAIAIFDGSFAGTDPPLEMVVRDRSTGQVVHRAGPFYGATAVQEAHEAAGAIRVIGIEGYLHREAL